MSNIHSCTKCDSVLLKSYPVTKYQKCYEIFVSRVVEFGSGQDPCSFFKMLLEKCRWPQGYLENPDSRIAILFDNLIDSSYMVSIATLPRPPQNTDHDHFASATERYGELLQLECQIVTDRGTIS